MVRVHIGSIFSSSSRHVSGLPAPGPSISLALPVSERPRSSGSASPHTPRGAHLRSTLRNQHLSEHGRTDGRADVDKYATLTHHERSSGHSVDIPGILDYIFSA